MSRTRFGTRPLLIALGAASIALAAMVGLRKGAKAAGFLFPNDAVYLTIDLPRPDLHPVALFAMQDGRSRPVSPYLYMFYWHTVTDVIELDMHGPGVRNEPAAWVSAPEYVLIGRDANGGWRRWTFSAGENVRVVWSPTGTRAKIDVPEDAPLDAPSREDLLELGASEWMIDIPR